jgi:putative membrane protein
MFIDYITLLLVNLVAGFVLLAAYVFAGLEATDRRAWAPGFLIVGFIALLFGTAMTLTWPLPGPFNIAFGEMSVLFGVLFFMTGLCLAFGWSLTTVAGYAFFAGVAAVVIGVRIFHLGLTKVPWLSAIGFILAGVAGMLALPTLVCCARNRLVRTIAALVLLGTGLLWALTTYPAYWSHMTMGR